MASALNIINEWAAESEDKQTLFKSKPALVVAWLCAAQERYADKSEMLRGVWEPDVPESGNIDLPADFLREFYDRVKFNKNVQDRLPLKKVDFSAANLITWSAQTHYSIWAGKFYVWNKGALSPSIPYVRKPVTITVDTLADADLEIPSEFQRDLILYLDMSYDRSRDKINAIEKQSLLNIFDQVAADAGLKFRLRQDNAITMIAGRLG